MMMEVRLQDDFYAAINKDWLTTTKLKLGQRHGKRFLQMSIRS